MCSTPSSIVLTYFDIPGPAEAIRLTFYIAGVPFEDKRITRDEFAVMKKELPFEQLPILTVDGVAIPQSAAILRFADIIRLRTSGMVIGEGPCSHSPYLGNPSTETDPSIDPHVELDRRKYPKDPVKAAKCDAVIDCMFDIQAAIRPSIYETNPRRKLSMREELAQVTLPLWLGYLERWLEEAGTPFFAGNEISICDLVIYTRMKWLSRGVLVGIPNDVLRSVPRVRSHSETVARHPKIREYYESGPGKVTGDGSPPLPSPTPLSPIILPTRGGD